MELLIKSILATLLLIAPTFLLVVLGGVLIKDAYDVLTNQNKEETNVNDILEPTDKIVWIDDIPVVESVA